MPDATCNTADCDAPLYGRGFCQRHYNADYYRRRQDELKARAAAWRLANPERKRASDREWAKANPERKRANDARAWASKPERNREHHSRWYQANKEKNREGFQRRKARKLANGSERVSYVAVLARHGMTCHLCEGPILSRADLHFDHVIPLAQGGPHTEANIRPAHATCNLSKGARAPRPA